MAEFEHHRLLAFRHCVQEVDDVHDCALAKYAREQTMRNAR